MKYFTTREAESSALTARVRPTKVLTCTLAVCLMISRDPMGFLHRGFAALFDRRTDSWLGRRPLHCSDRIPQRTNRIRAEDRASPLGIVVAFLAYTVDRLLLSGSWTATVTWLRDGAPYLYAALALISAHAIGRATPDEVRRTTRLHLDGPDLPPGVDVSDRPVGGDKFLCGAHSIHGGWHLLWQARHRLSYRRRDCGALAAATPHE